MGIYSLIVDNQDMIIGAALAIGGNLLISIAMNVQKYSLTQLQRQEEEEAQQASQYAPSSETAQSSFMQKHKYLKNKIWWCGITLMVLGEVGNFMAYGFAPASVVAPLGTTTVVANTYIAIFFLGEHFRSQDALGTIVIVVGAFLIVMFSSQEDVRLDATEIADHLLQWPFLVYVAVEIALFITANFLLFWKEMIHVVLFILPAAILASATVIAAKATSGMITLTLLGHDQLIFFIFYVMLIILPITGVLQIRYVTQAMQYFNATVVVPTFFVFFTLSAILAGIFFYGEFDGLTFIQIIIFLFGCCFCFLGVSFISSGRINHDVNPSPPLRGGSKPQDGEVPVCPFPCASLAIQPPSDSEETPLIDGERQWPIISRPLSAREAPEDLFNPDLLMANDNSRLRKTSNGLADSYNSGTRLSLSWDASYDPLEVHKSKKTPGRTYRRVSNRPQATSSSSSDAGS